MSSEYVPLHLHTEYSLLDGAIRINDLIAKAKEFDMSTVAMTDHGNLFGAIEFYKKAPLQRHQRIQKPYPPCEQGIYRRVLL